MNYSRNRQMQKFQKELKIVSSKYDALVKQNAQLKSKISELESNGSGEGDEALKEEIKKLKSQITKKNAEIKKLKEGE